MTVEILRCLLLPIRERILLLPYSAVAEVVALENPNTYSSAKDWKLGKVAWRGLQIPLVCLEMSDPSMTKFEPLPTQHFAVLNRCSANPRIPDFVGVVLAGIPSMSRYKANDLRFVGDGDKPYLEMKVTARNVACAIPDLQWLEEHIN